MMRSGRACSLATARTTATNAAGTLAATLGEAIMHLSGIGDRGSILVSLLLGQAKILGLFGHAKGLAKGVGLLACVLVRLARHDGWTVTWSEGDTKLAILSMKMDGWIDTG